MHVHEALARHLAELGLDDGRLPDPQQWRTLLDGLSAELGRLDRLGQLLEHSPVVAFTWRNAPGWPMEFVSSNVQRFGYAPADLLSGRILYSSLIHPDDQLRIEQEVARHVASGPDVYHQEYRLQHADGRWLWVDDHTWLLRDETGQVVALHGVVMDISARKQAELALAASELRFRSLLEETPGIAVQGYDEARRVVVWNRASESLYGYSAQDAIGREMYCIDLDMTERRQAENAARESEARYRLLFETMTQGVVYQSSEGAILSANPAAARILGAPSDELVGRSAMEPDWQMLLEDGTPIEGPAHPAMEAIRTGRPVGPVVRAVFNPRKRAHAWLSITAIPLFRPGEAQPYQVYSTIEDITARKSDELELEAYRAHLEELVRERTAELEVARLRADAGSRAKSAFIANISHEIRTPLNAILGLAHLLRAGATAVQDERLRKIEAAGRHLLSILSDVLDISKIEAGRMRLEQTDFQLHALLEQVRALIAHQAAQKKIEVRVDTGDAPDCLRGDPTRLRQALLNYAGNAVKFTEHGHVTLRARVLEDAGESLSLRLEVEDTGIGIAADVLPQLFTAFEQGDASTTRRYGGTALGLVITQRLAALMGGEVGVESVPGEGSTFWLTVRLQRGSGERQAAPAEPRPAAGATASQGAPPGAAARGRRILLAEDNPVNREVAVALLQDAGLSVDTAKDGMQAIDMARRTPYDLVLMDVQMPRLDGIEATRALRRLPGYEATPILAMTANVFEDDRRHCLEAGMNDFIAKPVHPEDLYQALGRWLSARPDPQTTAIPAGGAASPSPVAADDPRLANCLAALAAIEGFDLDAALEATLGRAGWLRELLRVFAKAHGEDPARLRALADAGDEVGIERLAHSVKGAGGIIGAQHVAGLAAALQAVAARRAGESGALARQLADAMELLLARLETACAA